MATVPDEYHDLFEKPTFAHVVTMLPNGTPHPTPVWIDYDAEADHLLVNTERERRKAQNAEADQRVAVSMTDPDDPYRFFSIAGRIEEITIEGARDHVDELAGRYLGEEEYPNPVESERVILRIRPETVFEG